MKKERRRWTRIPVEHLVSYTIFDGQGEPEEMGMTRTLDLGGGGVVLEMPHPVEAGSHLQIKMVSGQHILRASGRVAYSQLLPTDRWRVGVSFIGIGEDDLVIISQEVEDHRQRKE